MIQILILILILISSLASVIIGPGVSVVPQMSGGGRQSEHETKQWMQLSLSGKYNLPFKKWVELRNKYFPKTDPKQQKYNGTLSTDSVTSDLYNIVENDTIKFVWNEEFYIVSKKNIFKKETPDCNYKIVYAEPFNTYRFVQNYDNLIFYPTDGDLCEIILSNDVIVGVIEGFPEIIIKTNHNFGTDCISIMGTVNKNKLYYFSNNGIPNERILKRYGVNPIQGYTPKTRREYEQMLKHFTTRFYIINRSLGDVVEWTPYKNIMTREKRNHGFYKYDYLGKEQAACSSAYTQDQLALCHELFQSRIDINDIRGDTSMFIGSYLRTWQNKNLDTFKRGAKLFDIGIGNGRSSYIWKRHSLKVFGVEPDIKNYKSLISKHIRNVTDVRNWSGEDERIQSWIYKSSIDYVMMSYSLTFFFESEQKLNQLLDNITWMIKPGGTFICLSMDGNRVHELWGKSDRVDNQAFKLVREYDDRTTFGSKIRITVKHRKTLVEDQTEYLTDMDYFENAVTSRGFETVRKEYIQPAPYHGESASWFVSSTCVMVFRRNAT
jgi:ubiquinone/menaquinone biosynthesis C-methylase UbiE